MPLQAGTGETDARRGGELSTGTTPQQAAARLLVVALLALVLAAAFAPVIYSSSSPLARLIEPYHPPGLMLLTATQLGVLVWLLAGCLDPRGRRAWLLRAARRPWGAALGRALAWFVVYGYLITFGLTLFAPLGVVQWFLAWALAAMALSFVAGRPVLVGLDVWALIIAAVAVGMTAGWWPLALVPATLLPHAAVRWRALLAAPPRPGSPIGLAVAGGVAATMLVTPLPLSALVGTDGAWVFGHELTGEQPGLLLIDGEQVQSLPSGTVERVHLLAPLRDRGLDRAWHRARLRPHLALRPFAAGWAVDWTGGGNTLLLPAAIRGRAWIRRRRNEADAWLQAHRARLRRQLATQRVAWDDDGLRVAGGYPRPQRWDGALAGQLDWPRPYFVDEAAELTWDTLIGLQSRRVPGFPHPVALLETRHSRVTIVVTPELARRLEPALIAHGIELERWRAALKRPLNEAWR